MVTTQTIISTPGMMPNVIANQEYGVNVLGGSSSWPAGTTKYTVTWIGAPLALGGWTLAVGDYGSTVDDGTFDSPFVVTVLAMNDALETLGVWAAEIKSAT